MTNFYPPVTDLVSTHDIPEKLGFIKQGIDILIGNLHYKDYIQDVSRYGDQGMVSITIVPAVPMDFPILGTEMQLIFNPGVEPSTTEFPISMSYEWEVLKYIRGFRINNFTGIARDLFDLLLEILGTSREDLLEGSMMGFIYTDDDDHVQLFIDNFNIKYSPNQLTHPNTGDFKTDISGLLSQLDSMSINSTDVIFDDYLAQDDGSGEDVETIAQYNIESLFSYIRNSFSLDRFKQMLVPQASASLDNISIGLTFPTKYVRQVDKDTFEPLKDAYGEDMPSMLTLNVGRMRFSTEDGFEFENENSFSFPPSEIGKSGLIVQFQDLKLDLSRTKNIPEASADNRPTDFIGAYVTEGIISLPKRWFKQDSGTTGQIYARNFLIGTGGISGFLGLEAHPTVTLPEGEEPELRLKLGSDKGFAIALNRFNVEFRQNAIIHTDVKGSLTIPKFKKKKSDGSGYEDDLTLGVMVHFNSDGDFSITASPDEENQTIGIEGVFDFHVNTFSIGRTDDRYFIATTGLLDITATVGGEALMPQGIEIQKLIIWEDGSFEIATRPPLPIGFRLKYGPVELYVSNIHIGSYEKDGRPYKYIGFDGGIDTTPTSVDAKGTGIKLYFSVDDKPLDVFIRIQRIDIDLIIPARSTPETAALLLKGYLAVRDGANGTTEYAGGIEMTLPKLNLRGKAAMRLNPQRPSFVVDAEIEAKKGIPLGATGLSVYGFRGLIGNNYIADKETQGLGLTNDDPWWQYYKTEYPNPGDEGINIEKFNDEKDGFSLGAGVSLATGADNGRLFYSKLFFLLSLPNVFLFEGKAGILKKKNGFSTNDEPPFFALLSIDNTSIEAALGVDYKLPEDGPLFKKIARLYGIMEMGFFWGNSSAWYVNIGRDLPEDMRVQARIGELFDAYAYLMLSLQTNQSRCRSFIWRYLSLA